MLPAKEHYMSKKDTLVVVVNLGTPDEPKVGAVRRYLTQFLNDRRVIDIPWLGRTLLVNGIIIPTRAKNSTQLYKELWTEEGSPLVVYGNKLVELLNKQMPEADVTLAMRYQNPGLKDVLAKYQNENYKKIIFFPMFPQYASSSSGSAMEEAMQIVSKWWVIPECIFMGQYFDHPAYLDALAQTANGIDYNEYDHIIMSYHGLPERQLDKTYEGDKLCADHSCEDHYGRDNRYCYKAACYETSRELAKRIGITEEQYTVGFQSRLGKGWIEPFTDDIIKQLAKEGKKKLLFFAPSFTADCLETTVEITTEYRELFEEHGGEKVTLVPSLNDNPSWASAIKEMVSKYI